MTKRPLIVAGVASLALAVQAVAQNPNYLRPVLEIEQRLDSLPFRLIGVQGIRSQDDSTKRVALAYGDSVVLFAKLKAAPPGGDQDFNNRPRYELAAYRLQKLFLEPDDYVVPPNALRALPLIWVQQWNERAIPTFEGTRSVLVALQYWVSSVTSKNFFDRTRFRTDTLYARHLADMNILTYLIRHSDSNPGNFLISQDSTAPHVYAVDNGVAFRSKASDRGVEWQDLRVDRLPRGTVERLRAITPERLDQALGVLAQFTVTARGELVPAAPGPVLNRNEGVRRKGAIVQFGLTQPEIQDVQSRLRGLLTRVDHGTIGLF